MTFSGQVHHRIRLMLCEHAIHGVFIANIRMLKNIAVAIADFTKRLKVAGIGQLVHVDDVVLGIFNNMSYNR